MVAVTGFGIFKNVGNVAVWKFEYSADISGATDEVQRQDPRSRENKKHNRPNLDPDFSAPVSETPSER
jgi:hypothetical protein